MKGGWSKQRLAEGDYAGEGHGCCYCCGRCCLVTCCIIITTVLLLTAVGIGVYFAMRNGAFGGYELSGKEATQNRSVGAFHSISVGIAGEITIVPGVPGQLQITADTAVLNHTTSGVFADQLKISSNGSCMGDSSGNFAGCSRITISLPAANLSSLDISGSAKVFLRPGQTSKAFQSHLSGSGHLTGSLNASGSLGLFTSGSGRIQLRATGQTTQLRASGSGGISLTVVTSSVTTRISGSGSIDVAGSAPQSVSATVSGSGSFDGRQLGPVASATGDVSGSGDVKFGNVTQSLSATVSGSGSISYCGHPTVHKDLSGSGHLDANSC